MTTLSDATLETAKCLQLAMESVATGGSATTVTDTTISEPNDYFTGGTIWIKSGLNAGKSAKITSYVGSTGVFTFATMTLLNAAADRYAAAPPDFPRWLLIQKVNEAMRTMGGVPAEDSSLTTVTNQLDYNLPTGVRNVKKVEIAYLTSSPKQYADFSGACKEVNSVLRFSEGRAPDGGFTMRLTYVPEPSELTADSDTISPYYNLHRIGWEAAVHALRWIIKRRRGDDKIYGSLIVEAAERAKDMRRRYPMPRVGERIRTMQWGVA